MTSVSDIYEFTEELDNDFYSKKILIEGDSWTSHPLLADIDTQINAIDASEYLILNLAEPGDRATSIFNANGGQMKLLKKLLSTVGEGDIFDLIFLSAAGNDIVGPDIVGRGYVKNKRDFPNLYGRELLTENYYNQISDVAKGYDRFLAMRDKSLNADTPVVTHVYSYFMPREIGTHIGPFKFHKGWVKRHFKNQGIKEDDEHNDIMEGMLDALYRRLQCLEKKYEKFLVADTRQVLTKNGRPDVNLWYDEIHPTNSGFKKVVQRIKKVCEEKKMWDL